jgi:hypothetical protein
MSFICSSRGRDFCFSAFPCSNKSATDFGTKSPEEPSTNSFLLSLGVFQSSQIGSPFIVGTIPPTFNCLLILINYKI